jgi:kinesin family protein 18/19
LGDRDLNHLPTPDDSGSGSGSNSDGRSTSGSHIPKGHDRHVHGSPGRRGPPTPRVAGMGKSASGTGRRRSNVGPIRNEKGRRRSSLIPQLSPPNADSKSGARRVMIGDRSPAKRAKRMSLLGSGNASMSRSNSVRLKSNNIAGLTSMANLSIPAGISPDPNASGDMSFNKSFRPTWR